MELPFIRVGTTKGESNRGDRLGDLCFGHVRIEMSIRHPLRDVKQEVGCFGQNQTSCEEQVYCVTKHLIKM